MYFIYVRIKENIDIKGNSKYLEVLGKKCYVCYDSYEGFGKVKVHIYREYTEGLLFILEELEL